MTDRGQQDSGISDCLRRLLGLDEDDLVRDAPPSATEPLPATPETENEIARQLRRMLGLSEAGLDETKPSESWGKALEVAVGAGEEPVERLGRYPVTGQLGAGGMGSVLRVRDEDLDRELAAKVVSRDSDRRLLERFVLEARVTGHLEHPNIIPIHELGKTPEGRIFFTMKRVEGETLGAVIEGGARSLNDLLTIFVKVTDAIAFAHSRGILHRDLKPANVMVGRFGEVQVVDWGLAKILGQPEAGPTPAVSARDLLRLLGSAEGETERTMAGTVMGTLAYMPPEQAEGRIESLDQRADIYSLGAILYQILTRAQPFQGTSYWSLLQSVLAGDLVSPSERAPDRDIPWDLEAVVRKAMSRRPEDRYPTVEALRADVDRYLDGRTLDAAEYSPIQVLAKWARRHRATVVPAAIGAATALVLIVGLAISTAVKNRQIAAERDVAVLEREQADVARQAAQEAERATAEALVVAEAERSRATRSLAQSQLEAAERHIARGEFDRAFALAARARTIDDGPRARSLAAMADVLPWPRLVRTLRLQTTGPLQWRQDGRSILFPVDRDNYRHLDAGTGQPIGRFVHPGVVEFSPDLSLVAVDDGRSLSILDVATARPLARLRSAGDTIVWSPDGSRFASLGADRVEVYGTASEAFGPVLRLSDASVWGPSRFSPDGRRLLLGPGRMLDVDSGRVLWEEGFAEHAVAFSPDGRRVAQGVGRYGGFGVTVRDADTGRVVRALPEPTGDVKGLAFGPAGRLLAASSADLSVYVWDLSEGRLLTVLSGFVLEPVILGISGDGRFLDLCTAPGAEALAVIAPDLRRHPREWRRYALPGPAATVRRSVGLGQPAEGLRFSPDGGTVATVGGGGILAMRFPDWTPVWGHRPAVARALTGEHPSFSADGRYLAHATADRTIEIVDGHTFAPVSTIESQPERPAIAFENVSGHLVSFTADGRTRLWDPATGALVREIEFPGPEWEPTAARCHPSRPWLAVTSEGNGVAVFDLESGRILGRAEGGLDLCWLPGTDVVVTAGNDGTLRGYDPSKDAVVATWGVLSRWVRGVETVAPNGLLAVGPADPPTLFDARTGRLIGLLPAPVEGGEHVAVHPSGEWAVVTTADFHFVVSPISAVLRGETAAETAARARRDTGLVIEGIEARVDFPVTYLVEFLTGVDEDPSTLPGRALAAYRAGDHERAADAWTRALATHGAPATWRWGLLMSRLHLGDREAALDAAATVLAADPRFESLLGGPVDEAGARAALVERSASIGAFLGLVLGRFFAGSTSPIVESEIALLLGLVESGESAGRPGVERPFRLPPIPSIAAGATADSAPRDSDAVAAAREAVARRPDDPERHFALSTALEADGRHLDALASVADALDRGPEPWMRLAGEHFRRSLEKGDTGEIRLLIGMAGPRLESSDPAFAGRLEAVLAILDQIESDR